MKKGRYFVLLVTFAVSVTSVYLIYLYSNWINHSKNNFIRLMPSHVTNLSRVVNVKYNSYYIAGSSGNIVYLGNTVNPTHVLLVDIQQSDTRYVHLELPADNLISKNARVQIDSPYFYLKDGTLPAIYRGDLRKGDWKVQRYTHDRAYFIEALPFGSQSVAIRSLTTSSENALGKMQMASPQIDLYSGLLRKQIDGVFCTDGMLHYDRHTGRLTYLYRYRNEFLQMDTSFNLLYRGKTIDTTSVAKIKVAKLNSGQSYTFSAPPVIVNIESSVWRNGMFVQSGLLASNEIEREFNSSSVIDVYDLNSNSYKLSFYLERHGGKKLHSFKVIGNKLIALHDHYLLCYDLTLPYFSFISRKV